MSFELKKGKKILVILTNKSTLESHHQHPESTASNSNRTGFDVKAVAYIWEFLKEKRGFELVFVTPEGGEAPMDPRSLQLSESDEVVQKFLKDRSFVDRFKNTEKAKEILEEHHEYCAVFIPGSHGVLMDVPYCHELSLVICKIYEKDGCIATLGHGVAGLLNVPAPKSLSSASKEYLISGKKVCCSTKEEEQKLNMEKQLPYFLEEKLRDRGAKLENKGPFEINVVRDERLITAQNNQSAKEWIMTIMKEAKLL